MNRQLLIFEPKSAARKKLATPLLEAGYRLLETGSVRKAIKAIEAGEICAVVCRPDLPEEDYRQIVAAAQTCEPALPVLMVSESNTLMRVFGRHEESIPATDLRESSEQLEALIEERTERFRFASQQLSALNQVSIKLTQFSNEDGLLEAAPKLLTESLDFDRSMLTLLRTDGSLYLRTMAAPRDSQKLIKDFIERMNRADVVVPPHIYECIEQNETVFIEDLNNDPRWPKLEGEIIRTKSIVFTPLRVGGRVIGVISGNMQHHSRQMDHQDIERIETFANMVGLALDNIRAYRSLEDKVVERTQSLQESKEKLAHSIEELQAILNASEGSLLMVNKDGFVTARNDKVRKMFGLVEDPIRGTSFEEFKNRIEPCFENKQAFRKLLKDLDEHASAVYADDAIDAEYNPKLIYERALKITFPEPMELGVFSGRVLDSVGEEIGRVWSFSDVTALKRADTQLRAIIDASPIPILVSRLEDGRILYANQPLADLIGVPHGSSIGRKTPDFYADPAERDHIRQRLATEGRVQHYEAQIRREDGSTIWMLFNLETVDLNGEKVIIGGLFDISERKQAEERLAKRFRYEEALAACTQALLTGEDTDATLQIVLEKLRLASNATSVYIFKYFEGPHEKYCRMIYEAADPRFEKSGMDDPNLQLLRVDLDDPKWQQIIRGEPHEASTEDPCEETRQRMMHTGTKSMLNLPIFIERIWYGFLGFVDVERPRVWTDDDKRLLKTAAEMIGVYFYKKRVLSDLEEANRRIRETQMQLVQTEKMASLGMLVAGVAHEINTPVGALSSMHQTLVRAFEKLHEMLKKEAECSSTLQQPDVEAAFKVIEDANKVINNGAKRVTEIVRRLRSFARLDEAERTRANIHDGIENTLTLIHHEIKHKVTVHKEFGAIPEIVCYPGQLNQVFLNILVNAKQAIEDKGEITIKTGMDNDMVRIDISDTGKGISKEHLPRIFDPGFTTKGVGIGTGLGLSIVYQIIQAHSGKIFATSEVGKGTTFTILLPTNLTEMPNNTDKKED